MDEESTGGERLTEYRWRLMSRVQVENNEQSIGGD